MAPKTTSPPTELGGAGGHGPPCDGPAGFTLLELLTVLALLSVLLGIGAGAFRRVSLGKALAVAQVKDALRAARLFAIEEQNPARVEIDAPSGTMRTVGFVRVGNWHFEREGDGWPTGWEARGEVERTDEGALGAALSLGGSPGDAVVLGRSPSFDSPDGVAIEVFVLRREGSEGTLLGKGRSFGLEATAAGGVSGWVALRRGKPKDPPRRLRVDVDGGLDAGRFVRVGLSFEGTRLTLALDGWPAAVAELEEPERMEPDPEAPLVLGGGNTPLAAILDEVALSIVVSRTWPELPDGVRFGSSGVVHFDERGRLDPMLHKKPVVVPLLYEEDRRRRDVVVGLLGDVR